MKTQPSASDESEVKPHLEYHKDGSLRARGQTVGGVFSGYWEWFRLDGTLLRSGTFTNGEQTGEWTTYDAQGRVYKVTRMRPRQSQG